LLEVLARGPGSRSWLEVLARDPESLRYRGRRALRRPGRRHDPRGGACYEMSPGLTSATGVSEEGDG